MHDVTKRGLALAVATGSLLITGAAPAVSAVHHAEHADGAGTTSRLDDGSSGQAAQSAPISVSGSTVQQYEGRHKTPEGVATAAAAASGRGWALAEHKMHHGNGEQRSRLDETPFDADYADDSDYAGEPDYGDEDVATVASPAGAASTGSNGSLLTNNKVQVPVHAPVNVCGVVVDVVGSRDARLGDDCVNGPDVAGGTSTSTAAVAGADGGVLNDNVVQVPVSMPANVCGDTVTVVGGRNSVQDIFCANEGPATSSTAYAHTADAPGFVNANVVQVPVDVPLNACGVTANALAFHDAAVGDSCRNGSTPPRETYARTAGALAAATTTGSVGLADGNIVQVPIEAPLDVCGDTVDALAEGDPALDNLCVNDTMGGALAHGVATGNRGAVSGNVVQLPVDIPAEACGVVAGVAAAHNAARGNMCDTEMGGEPSAMSSGDAADEPGIAAGNVGQGSVNLPLQAVGAPLAVAMSHSPSEDNSAFTGMAPAAWSDASATAPHTAPKMRMRTVSSPAESEMTSGLSPAEPGTVSELSAAEPQAAPEVSLAEPAAAPVLLPAEPEAASSLLPVELGAAPELAPADSETAPADSDMASAWPDESPSPTTRGGGAPQPPGPPAPPSCQQPPTPGSPPPPCQQQPPPPPPTCEQPPPPVTPPPPDQPPPVMPPPPPPNQPPPVTPPPPPPNQPPPPVTPPPSTPPGTPPGTPPATPPQTATPQLPHTGADVLGLAAIGAGAVLVGAGAVVAARRRSGSAN